MKVVVTYVDDEIEPLLSKYLSQRLQADVREMLCDESVRVEYGEVTYASDGGYQGLLSDERLRTSNIALLDSKLFKLDAAKADLPTGEVVALLMRRYLPFVETFIITSYKEELPASCQVLAKYDHSKNANVAPNEYYSSLLRGPISRAICSLKVIKHAEAEMRNGSVEGPVREKVENSIHGISHFDELTTVDVDRLIASFEELKKAIVGGD